MVSVIIWTARGIKRFIFWYKTYIIFSIMKRLTENDVQRIFYVFGITFFQYNYWQLLYSSGCSLLHLNIWYVYIQIYFQHCIQENTFNVLYNNTDPHTLICCLCRWGGISKIDLLPHFLTFSLIFSHIAMSFDLKNIYNW